MKQQTIAGLFILTLLTGCGQPVSIESQRTVAASEEGAGQGVDTDTESLEMLEAGINPDSLPENELIELDFDGMQLAPSNNERTQAIIDFISQGIAHLQEVAANSRQAAALAIGVEKTVGGEKIGCHFLKTTYRDANGDIVKTTIIPEDQPADCVTAFQNKRGSTALAGGYIAAAVKLTPTTYGAAVGLGVLAVSQNHVAGCAVGAMGAFSQEANWAGGTAGGVCGSVSPNGATGTSF